MEMKRFSILVVLLGVIAFTLSIVRLGMTDQATEKKNSEPAKLEELYKVRIDTLENLVKITKVQYEVGTASFEEFSQAQEDLIKAKLEATDKIAERIALLEEQLATSQKVLEFVEKRVKMGGCTERESLRAKANCLTVEIHLYKERAKAKDAG
jgi:outer membrane protein TolC